MNNLEKCETRCDIKIGYWNRENYWPVIKSIRMGILLQNISRSFRKTIAVCLKPQNTSAITRENVESASLMFDGTKLHFTIIIIYIPSVGPKNPSVNLHILYDIGFDTKVPFDIFLSGHKFSLLVFQICNA